MEQGIVAQAFRLGAGEWVEYDHRKQRSSYQEFLGRRKGRHPYTQTYRVPIGGLVQLAEALDVTLAYPMYVSEDECPLAVLTVDLAIGVGWDTQIAETMYGAVEYARPMFLAAPDVVERLRPRSSRMTDLIRGATGQMQQQDS